MQVHLHYPTRSKVFSVNTTLRKQVIKSMARRFYNKAAATAVKCRIISAKVLLEVTRKIKRELRAMSSDDHSSILHDTTEAVKCFSWEMVMLKLEHSAPTLIKFLQLLVAQPIDCKPLICFIAPLVLKARHHGYVLYNEQYQLCYMEME